MIAKTILTKMVKRGIGKATLLLSIDLETTLFTLQYH